MPRPSVIIENPILNTPLREPDHYFKFDDDGITDEQVAGRRPSTYFVPIPKPRAKIKQISLEDWTEDCKKENKHIDEILARVAMWRMNGCFGLSHTMDVSKMSRSILIGHRRKSLGSGGFWK